MASWPRPGRNGCSRARAGPEPTPHTCCPRPVSCAGWRRSQRATAVRSEGIAVCFQHFPEVEVLLDDGYLGLRRDHPGQAITPPRKPNKIAFPHMHATREEARHEHSSKRITVEHALADHRRWKQVTRFTHRRDDLPDTYRAIAGLVFDHTANG